MVTENARLLPVRCRAADGVPPDKRGSLLWFQRAADLGYSAEGRSVS
jgi:hypothetical protein